jgi:hypothetical protein
LDVFNNSEINGFHKNSTVCFIVHNSLGIALNGAPYA